MYDDLRRRVAAGVARVEVAALTHAHLGAIAWSGSRTHLDNVARQLERVAAGEVNYLAVFVDGEPVSKGGIDFAKEEAAGTIWQLATHPRLRGLGLATTLIRELERCALGRGVTTLRLGVEPDNEVAIRLYQRLGYTAVGESEASWEAERVDGSRFLHTTTLVEMAKQVEVDGGDSLSV